MVEIRLFEESLVDPILRGEIKTPCHLYTGQEAVAVGVCAALTDNDYILGNHRSHGHYLAKGGSIDKLMLEIFGKKDGCAKGRGGSMHIIDNQHGLLGTVPLVAATISLALGAALSSKINKDKKVTISFFGDGAVDEGVLHESLNFASLKKLPIIFVCENNLYSTHMPIKDCLANTKIYEFAKSYNMPSKQVQGNDVLKVYNTTKTMVKYAKNNQGPSFIECLTYRMRGHVGPDDNIQGEHTDIRPNKEVIKWAKKDPIKNFEKILMKKNILNKQTINNIYKKLNSKIIKAYKLTLKSDFPKQGELLKHVYEK